MKKIVVVDSAPWRVCDCIQQFKSEGICFTATIWHMGVTVRPGWSENYEKITGMPIIEAHLWSDFIKVMDEYYSDPDVIFLMNYDLTGTASITDFFDRVNVKYALEKDKEQKRIFFYSSGFQDVQDLLDKTFPGNTIIVTHSKGYLYWDLNQVKAAVDICDEVSLCNDANVVLN